MNDNLVTLTRRLRRTRQTLGVVAIVGALATSASIYQRRRIGQLEERADRYADLCYSLGESIRDTRRGVDELTAPGHVPRFGETPERQADLQGRIYQDLPFLYYCVPDEWPEISRCLGNHECTGEALADALAKLPTRR
jgi:hypothetical protein